jgi:hypothetical protein
MDTDMGPMWRGASLIFLIALTVRVGLVFALGIPARSVRHNEIGRASIALAATGTLADPFAVPSGRTAHVAPGFPFIAAAALRLYGDAPVGRAVVSILNALFAALAYALWPLVAWRAGLPWRLGFYAAAVPAALPLYGTVETSFFESSLTTLASVVVTLETLRLWQQPRLSAAKGMRFGCVWGATLLIGPQLVLVLFAYLGCLFAARPRPLHRGAFVAGLLVTTALALAPWTVRNYYATGGLVFVRSNIGLELYV